MARISDGDQSCRTSEAGSDIKSTLRGSERYDGSLWTSVQRLVKNLIERRARDRAQELAVRVVAEHEDLPGDRIDDVQYVAPLLAGDGDQLEPAHVLHREVGRGRLRGEQAGNE